METLSIFHYRHGKSLLHRLDVRCKLVCLCFMSMGLVRADLTTLPVITGLTAFLMIDSRISPVKLFQDLTVFYILLGCIFLSRALFTPGEAIYAWKGFTVTRQGLSEGGLVTWRFFMVMVLGLLFSATTRPSLVKGAVQWLITPIPWIPAQKTALMVSLFLRFLPMLLGQFKDVALAQQARCGNLEKNPVKRMSRLATPMIRKTFQSADKLTLAMEARCFSEDRTEAKFIRSGREGVVLGVCIVLSVTMIVV